jgi:hypothetical protein
MCLAKSAGTGMTQGMSFTLGLFSTSSLSCTIHQAGHCCGCVCCMRCSKDALCQGDQRTEMHFLLYAADQ